MSFIRIINQIPEKVAIAVSGGIDSMVCLDFLLNSKRDILVLHYNHNTDGSDYYEEFVTSYCKKRNIRIKKCKLDLEIPKKRSKEDFWREKRYEFFSKSREGRKVILCHHLDDVIETWVFSALNGKPKLIPYERDYVIRPFLLNKKSVFKSWSENKKTLFVEDKTNYNNNFSRNYIRNVMMKDILYINPGIYKNLKKKIISKWRI